MAVAVGSGVQHDGRNLWTTSDSLRSTALNALLGTRERPALGGLHKPSIISQAGRRVECRGLTKPAACMYLAVGQQVAQPEAGLKVFLYEYVTGGGFLDQPFDAIPPSLAQEGLAMRRAVEEDIASLPGALLVSMNDRRFPPTEIHGASVASIESSTRHDSEFARLASAADWTLLIAPEFDGQLERLARRVLNSGGKLLGPSRELIALAADKHRLALQLTEHNVPTPRGRRIARDEPLPLDVQYPCVLKPVDGAGSLGVELIEHPEQVDLRRHTDLRNWRLEEFCPGLAASVAVLCGKASCFPLPACAQLLSDDGRFQYLGGGVPLPETIQARAHRLALAAVAALSEVNGYVGVDLVLGSDPDGGEDVVIEVNPRITTSYVGLRKLCRGNLVCAMLDVAEGRALQLEFDSTPIRFTPHGQVHFLNEARV